MKATLYNKCVAAAFIALSIMFMQSAVTAQTICAPRQTEGLRFGPIPKGESESKHIVIANTTSELIAIYAIDLRSESSEWSLREVPQLPYKLEPGKEIAIIATYKPDGNSRSSEARVRTTYLCRSSESRQFADTKLVGTLKIPACGLRQTEVLRFGPVIFGETECKRIKIANTTSQVITLYEIGIRANTPEWKLDELPELPMRLQPGTDITIAACYSPNGHASESKAEVKSIYICESGDGRMAATTVMAGTAVRRTCVMRQTPTIKFRDSKSTDDRNCERLKFTNTGNQVVVLHSVEVYENNPNFTLAEVPTLPVRIQPGTTLTIGVCFTPSRIGCVRGKIVAVHSCANNLDAKTRLVTEVGGCLVKGTNTGSSAAAHDGGANSIIRSQNMQSMPDVNLSLTVTPNPSHGSVRISLTGAENTSLQIFDMLGKEVYSSSGGSEVQWNANASGVYIVRSTGIDTNGEEFIVSKRLIIDK